MREKIKKFSKYTNSFCLHRKGLFNSLQSRKVKGRATSSENRKFFVAVMEGTLGVVKKMLTNSGEIVVGVCCFCKAGKTLAVGRGLVIWERVV